MHFLICQYLNFLSSHQLSLNFVILLIVSNKNKLII